MAVLAGLLLPCAAIAATELPPALTGIGGPAGARFAVGATNGYTVSVEGRGDQVTLTVEGHAATAVYSARGRASNGLLKARFGKLGRVAVRFKPAGKPRRTKPPRRCEGEDRVTQRGVFLGTIRFRGERGYTRVRRSRARGTTTTSPRWRCRPRRGSRDKESNSEFDDVTLGLPTLGAYTPNSRVVFAAMGEDEPGDFDLIFFVAGTTERRGSLRIDRFAAVLGQARAFAIEDDLSAATVDPPEPFNDTASFARNADGPTSWSGALTVSLPGAPAVALTGPTFSADLARPKTFREFAALFGVSHLLYISDTGE